METIARAEKVSAKSYLVRAGVWRCAVGCVLPMDLRRAHSWRKRGVCETRRRQSNSCHLLSPNAHMHSYLQTSGSLQRPLHVCMHRHGRSRAGTLNELSVFRYRTHVCHTFSVYKNPHPICLLFSFFVCRTSLQAPVDCYGNIVGR